MGKNCLVKDKRERLMNLFSELGMPKNLAKTLVFLSESETNDDEETETKKLNDIDIYKALRYPPGSKPPTAN